MSTKNSLLVAFAIIVAAGAGVLWLRRGIHFTVAAPTYTLVEFPRSIDGWQGTESELQEGVTRVLNSADAVSLRFEKGGEPPVIMHLATWTNPESIRDACPHHPTICYPANGWTVRQRQKMEVDVEGVGKVPVEIIVMRRGDEQAIVACNYRIGDNVYTDEPTARRIHSQYSNKPVWPSVTKLMIHVGTTDMESAKPAIKHFVQAFHQWYRS